jgi:hypothetical protein
MDVGYKKSVKFYLYEKHDKTWPRKMKNELKEQTDTAARCL